MLKRLRGVAREHRRQEIQFVSLSSVIQIVDAATKLHIQLNGRESVNPRQREPLTNAIIERMLTLAEDTSVGNLVVGANLARRRLNRFECFEYFLNSLILFMNRITAS